MKRIMMGASLQLRRWAWTEQTISKCPSNTLLHLRIPSTRPKENSLDGFDGAILNKLLLPYPSGYFRPPEKPGKLGAPGETVYGVEGRRVGLRKSMLRSTNPLQLVFVPI
jgi:hypothetical protein